jgi:NADH dehydrogenase
VADLRSWKLHGLFAWLIWMFIHIMSLIGFKNKLLTFIQWSGSYFSYDKPLGIIIPTTKRKE